MGERMTNEEMRLEFERDRVIAQNFEFLKTNMRDTAESFGGNAGSFVVNGNKYPAIGIHARVEISTGFIRALRWDSTKDEKDVVGGAAGVIFHGAVDLSRHPDDEHIFFIKDIFNIEALSEEAQYRLLETINMWNDRYKRPKDIKDNFDDEQIIPRVWQPPEKRLI